MAQWSNEECGPNMGPNVEPNAVPLQKTACCELNSVTHIMGYHMSSA